MESTTNTPATTTTSLPPVGTLFKNSWETFKASVLNLFILNILALVGYVALAIVAVIPLLLLGAGTALSKGTFDIQNFLQPSLIIPGIILFILFILGAIIIGIIFQIGSILIIDNPKQPFSLGSIIKKGLSLSLPLLGLGILLIILIWGGMFVFILPAILFYIFFMFASYVLILDGQGGTYALKRSYALVSQNFWGIFGRLLLLVGIYIIIAIITNILTQSSKEASAAVSILSFIINTLLGWFALAYVITLYKQSLRAYALKQAKATVPSDATKGITWIWIVTVVGWVISILVIGVILSTNPFQKIKDAQIPKQNSQQDIQELQKELENLQKELPQGAEGSNTLEVQKEIIQKTTKTTTSKLN